MYASSLNTFHKQEDEEEDAEASKKKKSKSEVEISDDCKTRLIAMKLLTNYLLYREEKTADESAKSIISLLTQTIVNHKGKRFDT